MKLPFKSFMIVYNHVFKSIFIFVIPGTKIDETLYAWVAVFLLPVNSALNPVLYTLTTRLFKQQLNRFLSNLRPLKRAPSDRHSAQSWSSLPYYRNSKKTLLTTFSDVSFHLTFLLRFTLKSDVPPDARADGINQAAPKVAYTNCARLLSAFAITG